MSHPRYGLAWLTTILSRAQSRVTIGETNDNQTEDTQSTGGEARDALGIESLPYDGTTADICKMIARVHFLEGPKAGITR